MRKRLLLILSLVLLALPAAPALAAPAHHRPHHCYVVRHHHRHRIRCPRRHRPAPARSAPSPALSATSGAATAGFAVPPPGWTPPALPSSGAPPSILGVGQLPGCLYGADPVPTLAEYPGTSAMRVIISPLNASGTSGEAAPCLAAAVAAGYRVELVIQWRGGSSDQQIADLFTTELGYYARFAWAVAIGNEPEMYWDGPPDTPAQYAEHWRVAAPIARRMAPGALLVAGEFSPWGDGDLEQAWADGLPGAQVIAGHAYQGVGVFSLVTIEAWCQQIGLPFWVTEGMAGPGAWAPTLDLRADQLLGVQAGFIWLG
jgi:hypothetical protein